MSTSPLDRRVRVAFVAPSLGILGGQAVQADRLLRGWNGDGDVTAWLVPVNPAAPRPLRPLQRVKYLRTLVTQLVYWPQLVAELHRADVVHVFSASYSSFVLAPWPAVQVARALGKPVVLNYRSGEAPDHLRRSRLARRTLGSVDLNVVPSAFLQGVFEGFGIPATVIPNIVDLERFRFRERHPLAPRLLSTRNFEPLYDLPCTLRAFRRVQAVYPEATLTLVGGGSQEHALRALAVDLSLRGVEFAGRVSSDAIHRCYDDHDIYVQTPRLDNMPTSVLEAYASGTPVVSSDVGGVPAILTHEHDGLLVPADDDRAAADAVLRLLQDPALAQRLAHNARAACGGYTWASVRDQWLNAYRSVFATAPTAAAVAAR